MAREQAAVLPGLELVILFGSAARGGASSGAPRPDSDADIAVLGGGFWPQLGLGSALAARLGREPHVVDLRHAPEALAYEVARTGQLLYEHEPFAWARFQANAASRFFDFQTVREHCAQGVRRRLLQEQTRRLGGKHG